MPTNAAGERTITDIGARNRVAARLASILAVLIAAVVTTVPVGAEARGPAGSDPAQDPGAVLLLLDLSGSMLEGSPTKLDQAKEAVRRTVESLPADFPVGLRVYGDQFDARAPADRQANCETDSRLVVPVGTDSHDAVLQAVDLLTARGDTPIGMALEQAAGDLPAGVRTTIVLISDGRDECFDADLDGDPAVGPSWGPDPCQVAAALAARSVEIRLDRIETVGFLADVVAADQLQCIATATGGSYTPAADADELAEKLTALTARALRDVVRLGGERVHGSPIHFDAPAITGAAPSSGRYTDTVVPGEPRFYRMAMVRDWTATVTVTIFDLPQVEGTELRIEWLDEQAERFRGETRRDAGLDGASASARLAGIHWSGRGDIDVIDTFLVVHVTNDEQPGALVGPFDIEITLEGLGVGATALGCPPESLCHYQRKAEALRERLTDRGVDVEAVPVAASPPPAPSTPASAGSAAVGVEGARDFRTAPQIEDGDFTDTIVVGETLWYAVVLANDDASMFEVRTAVEPPTADDVELELELVAPNLDRLERTSGDLVARGFYFGERDDQQAWTWYLAYTLSSSGTEGPPTTAEHALRFRISGTAAVDLSACADAASCAAHGEVAELEALLETGPSD